MVAMKTMYSQTLMEPINRTCVELIYGLIVPGVLGLESHGQHHIFDEDDENNGHQNGILKAKGQPPGGCMGQDAVMSVSDDREVQNPPEEHQGGDMAVDIGAAFCKVHIVLIQPMETPEKERRVNNSMME